MNTERNTRMMSHMIARKRQSGEDEWDRLDISPNEQNKVAKKQWGSELIITREPYACKVMTLEPGTTCSTHFHAEKQETFLLINGELVIELTNLNTGRQDTITLSKPYSSITIHPYVPHRFYAPNAQMGPTVFVESSTRDKDEDNYRFTESSNRATNNR